MSNSVRIIRSKGLSPSDADVSTDNLDMFLLLTSLWF